MLVALVVILMLLVMEMSIITKKSVATTGRHIRQTLLKVESVNVIKQHTKLKALDLSIRYSGKDVSVSFLADVLQDGWI